MDNVPVVDTVAKDFGDKTELARVFCSSLQPTILATNERKSTGCQKSYTAWRETKRYRLKRCSQSFTSKRRESRLGQMS